MPAGEESPAAGGSPASRLSRPVPASPRPRRPRSAPRAARSPRCHGDVVEDEPGRGQGAQLLLLAVLLLLHGAVAAAVLLAGRHGSLAGSAARTAGRRGSLRGGAGAALTAGPGAVSHPICLPRGPLPPPAAHMALRAPPSAPRVSPGQPEPAGAGEPPAAGTSCWDGTWPDRQAAGTDHLRKSDRKGRSSWKHRNMCLRLNSRESGRRLTGGNMPRPPPQRAKEPPARVTSRV